MDDFEAVTCNICDSSENDSFDVVNFLATLEYLPDPLTVLKEARRIIKSDGLLVVSVPTIPFYLKLVRSKWRMFIGDHYYFINDASTSEEWQPHNLGRADMAIRKLVMGTGMGKVGFDVNLFDSKVYFAEAASPQ